jgi:glycosyltransferase involved in cell wall biosynthesis
MKFAINALPFSRGGGVTYIENIVPKLATTDDEYYIFTSAGSDMTEDSYENITYTEVNFPTEILFLRLFYEQFVFPFRLMLHGIDVLYSPTGITTFCAPCPTVNAVRDPNPYIRQSNRTIKGKVKARSKRILTKISIWTSTDTIYVSEYTKAIVSNHISTERSRPHIVYHGINQKEFQSVSVPKDAELKNVIQKNSQYILCVSTIYEHKNYETLIRGYAELPQPLRERYPLIIVGGYTRESYYETIVNLTKSKGVSNSVFFIGKVKYKKIPFIYTNAIVTVLPSKLETFGHPLVESMASGVPLIAADSACIPEITDGAALLFDPETPTALSNHLQEVLTSNELREELINKGKKRVQKFSWDRTAERTHQILRQASNR